MHAVSLVKKSKPDTPTDLSPITAMSDNLLVKWTENFNGGLSNVTFKLQYRPQGKYRIYILINKQKGLKVVKNTDSEI